MCGCSPARPRPVREDAGVGREGAGYPTAARESRRSRPLVVRLTTTSTQRQAGPRGWEMSHHDRDGRHSAAPRAAITSALRGCPAARRTTRLYRVEHQHGRGALDAQPPYEIQAGLGVDLDVGHAGDHGRHVAQHAAGGPAGRAEGAGELHQRGAFTQFRAEFGRETRPRSAVAAGPSRVVTASHSPLPPWVSRPTVSSVPGAAKIPARTAKPEVDRRNVTRISATDRHRGWFTGRSWGSISDRP